MTRPTKKGTDILNTVPFAFCQGKVRPAEEKRRHGMEGKEELGKGKDQPSVQRDDTAKSSKGMATTGLASKGKGMARKDDESHWNGVVTRGSEKIFRKEKKDL